MRVPITSSAINLRGIVCLVYKREKSRVELTWRRACLLGAQDHRSERCYNPSDEERSTFHAVGNGKALLDAERVLIELNRKLIEASEKKIQTKLSEAWGKPAEDTT